MNEDMEVLDEIDNEKNKEDLRSVLNKKAYSKYELEEVMMGMEA